MDGLHSRAEAELTNQRSVHSARPWIVKGLCCSRDRNPGNQSHLVDTDGRVVGHVHDAAIHVAGQGKADDLCDVTVVGNRVGVGGVQPEPLCQAGERSQVPVASP